MVSRLKSLFVMISIIAAPCAHAAVVDMNIFYFTDGITADEDSSHASTLYNFLLGFDLDKKGMYQVGWNYSSHSTETENDGQTVTYKSTQMGPGFVIYMDKKREFRFGFSYNLKTLATYEANGGTEKDWRGTSMNADLGYQVRFEDAFSIGLRINYSQASYDESVEDTTKEDVSHKKTIIYPSAALTLDF